MVRRELALRPERRPKPASRRKRLRRGRGVERRQTAFDCGASALSRTPDACARPLSHQRRGACPTAPRKREVAASPATPARPRTGARQAQGIPDLPGGREGDLASPGRANTPEVLDPPAETEAPMTTGELIAKLRSNDPEGVREVVIWDGDEEQIKRVERVALKDDRVVVDVSQAG